MTETPTAAALEIPYAALERLCMLFTTLDDIRADTDGVERLRTVVAPVVAAELRRIADWHWDDNPVARDISAAIQARADELDPPTSKDT